MDKGMGRGDGNVISFIYVASCVFLPLLSLFISYPPSGGVSIRLLAMNLLQASISAFVATMGGLGISYVLARRDMPGILRSMVHSVSKVSFVFPGISMAIGFLILFGRNGILNSLLGMFGLRLDILYTFWAVVLGHAFYNIPVVVYITGTLWERMDGEILEAAQIDGASGIEIFRFVELPLILPSLVSSYLMAFIYSFTSFAVVMTIGGYRFRTIEVEIYSRVSLLDFRGAAALTLVQMSVVSSAAILASLLRPSEFPSGTPRREKMRYSDFITLIFPLSLVLVPMLSATISGLLEKDAFELLMRRGWGFLGVEPRKVFLDTFVLAMISSTVVTSVSLLTSRASSMGSKLSSVLMTIPTAVSPAVLAFSYLALSLNAGVDVHPIVALSILHSVISAPMVHRILESGWRGLPREIEEAALVDGANAVQRFLHVQLPLMLPSIVRSFTLGVAISMGELAGVLVISGGDFVTLSSAVYRLTSSRHLPEAMALNSIFSLLVLAIFLSGEMMGNSERSHG